MRELDEELVVEVETRTLWKFPVTLPEPPTVNVVTDDFGSPKLRTGLSVVHERNWKPMRGEASSVRLEPALNHPPEGEIPPEDAGRFSV